MDSITEHSWARHSSKPLSPYSTLCHNILPAEICHFRWFAQPSLFKLFIVRFNYSIPPNSGRRDIYPAGNLARLSVLQNAHIASGITEIRLLPSTYSDQRPKGLPTPELVTQMRWRFTQYFENVPDHFIGLNAFGHMVCKYQLEKTIRDITPAELPRYTRLTDTAPEERWNLDLTTEEGSNRIMDIIQQAKSVVLAEAAQHA